jgi:hypothetical protein
MPTIMTPTITTRRRKHFQSQQYTGMSFLTFCIVIECGLYSERLADIKYSIVVYSASPKERTSFFMSVLALVQYRDQFVTEIHRTL